MTTRKNVWKQPLAALWNRKAVNVIVKYALEHNCRLIYSNSAASFCGALAAKRLSLPHVWAIHEILSGPNAHLVSLLKGKRVTGWMKDLSCAVITNSETTARAFAGQPNVHVIPNGFEFSDPDPRGAADFRKRTGAVEHDFLLGIVGKLYPGKGQMEVVRVLPRLIEIFPRLKLVLIGGGEDSRYEKGIRRFRRKNGLENSLILMEYQTDLVSALHGLDGLIVPSKVESFGRVAVEAMAVRTPVLALACGGLEEIIEHGRTGFLLKDMKPETLTDVIRRVVEEQDFIQDVKKNASLYVRKHFSIEGHVTSVEQVIETCRERN